MSVYNGMGSCLVSTVWHSIVEMVVIRTPFTCGRRYHMTSDILDAMLDLSCLEK